MKRQMNFRVYEHLRPTDTRLTEDELIAKHERANEAIRKSRGQTNVATLTNSKPASRDEAVET